MRIFFGEDVNTAEGEHNKYGKAFDDAQVASRLHGVDSIGLFFTCSTFLPWPFGGEHGGLALRIWDYLCPRYRHLKACTKVLDIESNRLVKKCLEDPKFSERRDLLALFLQAKFSPDFVKQMVLHFIIAGRDTTACLLSWMFYELCRNQDVQLQLHEEIMKKLPPGTPMDWKSLSAGEMPYLNGVIYEALRLWPPVPFDLKMAFEDDVLPGGWKVPKMAQVAFIPYIMGRDGERYPEPLLFKPERWIPFNAPPQHEFPVFQAGPRICLGMDMAIFWGQDRRSGIAASLSVRDGARTRNHLRRQDHNGHQKQWQRWVHGLREAMVNNFGSTTWKANFCVWKFPKTWRQQCFLRSAAPDWCSDL